MPIYVDRYEQDHKSIGEFLLSGQLRDAVRQGASDGAAIAAATAPSKIAADFAVEAGPDVIVTKNGNPRLSERIVNDHPAAAAIEFGSGQRAEGASGKKDRPQGGSSPAYRPLGKAGARIADRIGGSDD